MWAKCLIKNFLETRDYKEFQPHNLWSLFKKLLISNRIRHHLTCCFGVHWTFHSILSSINNNDQQRTICFCFVISDTMRRTSQLKVHYIVAMIYRLIFITQLHSINEVCYIFITRFINKTTATTFHGRNLLMCVSSTNRETVLSMFIRLSIWNGWASNLLSNYDE